MSGTCISIWMHESANLQKQFLPLGSPLQTLRPGQRAFEKNHEKMSIDRQHTTDIKEQTPDNI